MGRVPIRRLTGDDFLSKKQVNWDKLDNTALLFPAIASENMTNVYRVSAVLSEEIDRAALQKAFNRVLPAFKAFKVRLRSGFFWYYFEENPRKPPAVEKEITFPGAYIDRSVSNQYLLRLSYHEKRINLEMFHALSDGFGVITFLKEIIYQYLRIRYPEALAGEPDSLSTDIFLDKEDSYIRNYKKPGKDRKKYVRTDALCITGPEFERPEIALIHGHMPVSALKEVCHRYGTTINTYLTAVYVWSIYKSVLNGRAGEKPIRCAVPVNLRPYYDSHTLKNFFAIIGAEFMPDREGYTFPEILEIVSDSLKSQMNRSNFDEIISYNVSNEMNMMLRIVPLFIKNFAIKQVFSASSHSYSTTMTNVGPVKVREPYKPYIKGFSVMLSMSEGQNIKAAIISYEDLLTVTFSSCLSDTSIQRCFFQELTKEGIPVTIETNGMYGEA